MIKKRSSANGPRKTENPHTEKVIIPLYLPLYTKTNPSWVKELNLKPETLKLLEESIGTTLHGRGIGKGFLNMTTYLPKRIFIKL